MPTARLSGVARYRSAGDFFFMGVTCVLSWPVTGSYEWLSTVRDNDVAMAARYGRGLRRSFLGVARRMG